jgi:hypothetical protein
MHVCERFLLAELFDEGGATTLEEALSQPARLSDDVARGGWFCRFHSQFSPANIHCLQRTVGLLMPEDDEHDALLAAMPEFRSEIALFLFALDSAGLFEVVLMPREGATVGAEEVAAAAADVLFGLVPAVGYSP